MATTTNTYLNSFKSFITDGFYLKKEKSYDFLHNYFSERDDDWGFAFPTDDYKWTDNDFSQAIECFQNILKHSENSNIYNFLDQPNPESFSPLTQIDLDTPTTCIAKHFGYERSSNKTLAMQMQNALKNEYQDYLNALDLLKSIKKNYKELKGNVKEKDIKAIASLLKNIFAGLCLFLYRIKEVVPQSSISSNSDSNSNTSEEIKEKQDNKEETPTENEQPQESSTAQEQSNVNVPEPTQIEREPDQSYNQENISIEDADAELHTEPLEEVKEVVGMDGKSATEDNAKPSDDDNLIGEESNGANEKETLHYKNAENCEMKEPNPKGEVDSNDSVDEGKRKNNNSPALSHDSILEKLERYEAIYRTFYFDELKSFLTKVNFNDTNDKYGYLHKVLETDYRIKEEKYNQIQAQKNKLEKKKKDSNLTKVEEEDLNKCNEKLKKAPTDYSRKKEYSFSCTPNDRFIAIAIEQFFDFLRKEGNEGLAEIMLHALSWCLSDVNGQPDISYSLKYGEIFIEKIVAYFGKDIEIIQRDLGKTTSDDKFNTNILCFQSILRYCKEYATPLHMLRTIRNLDIHHIPKCIDKEFWGRTIRLIIHTYIGAFYVANNNLKKFNSPKTLAPDFIFKSDGTLIISKTPKKNEPGKVWTVTNTTIDKKVELENFQKYSWNWEPNNQANKDDSKEPSPWMIRWNCANIKVILDNMHDPDFHLNTRFSEFLTAYIKEKFDVGTRLDSIEGSIADLTRLMNGNEKDDRSIKALLLAVLKKVEVLSKDKSNVNKRINEFSKQLESIAQTIKKQPDKIKEAVIKGIQDMNLPQSITDEIMTRIDPKLDQLIKTTDNIKEDTATIKEDTTEIKKTTADLKDTTHRLEDSVNEIEDSMVRAAWHTKETSDDVKEVKELAEKATKKLSEIDEKLNSKPPQQNVSDMPKGEGGPVYHIHVSGGNIGGISFGGGNTGNTVSGENTENTNSPATPNHTSSESRTGEVPPPTPPKVEETKKEDSSKWAFLLLLAIIAIIAVVLLLGRGQSIEQNVTVITDTEQVENPKSDEEKSSDKPVSIEKPENPGVQPQEVSNGATTPRSTTPAKPAPKPQPKVDTNYEAGMAAYTAGEGLEAIKKFQASGSADAYYMLGVIYENGCGSIAANQMKAREYYKKAKNLGSEKAKL